MVKLTRDFSRHDNKIYGSLSLKSLVVIILFICMIIFVCSLSFLNLFFKIIISIFLVILGLLSAFYRTVEQDDFLTYIIKLFFFYKNPKYLVYRKIKSSERRKKDA